MLPIPQIKFASWNNKEPADPVGTRHISSGSFAFLNEVGIGCESALKFRGLRLNINNNTPFIGSDIAVINFCFPNFGGLQASGITAINNMKIWLPSGSGTILDTGSAYLQYSTSGTWLPNLNFPSGAGSQLPNQLPEHANIHRIDGNYEINSFNDQNVSQWIYLRIFLDSDFPVGQYGACGSGIFRIRLTYDYY